MLAKELHVWLLVWYADCYCFHLGMDQVLNFVIRSKCLEYLLKSIENISWSYRIFISNISIVKQEPVIVCGFCCLRFIVAWVQTNLC